MPFAPLLDADPKLGSEDGESNGGMEVRTAFHRMARSLHGRFWLSNRTSLSPRRNKKNPETLRFPDIQYPTTYDSRSTNNVFSQQTTEVDPGFAYRPCIHTAAPRTVFPVTF
jgi:hypothetical protein